MDNTELLELIKEWVNIEGYTPRRKHMRFLLEQIDELLHIYQYKKLGDNHYRHRLEKAEKAVVLVEQIEKIIDGDFNNGKIAAIERLLKSKDI